MRAEQLLVPAFLITQPSATACDTQPTMGGDAGGRSPVVPVRLAVCLALILGACTTPTPGDELDSGAAAPDVGLAFATHEELRVEADDGSATLVIAANSLPLDASGADIRVRAGATSASVEVGADMELLASYELEPAGLVFREPARLEIRTDTETSPFGVLDSESGVEVVDVDVLAQSAETGRISLIAATIPHFSAFFATKALSMLFARGSEVLADTRLGLPTFTAVSVGLLPLSLATTVARGTRSVAIRFSPTGTWRGYTVSSGHERVSPTAAAQGEEQDIPFSVAVGYRCTSVGMMATTLRIDALAYLAVTIDGVGRAAGPIETRTSREAGTATGMCDFSVVDGFEDCTDSEGASVACSFFDEFLDLRSHGVLELTPAAQDVELLFNNTLYPCDDLGGALRTVCTATPGAFPEGPIWVAGMQLGVDVPDADPDHSLIYTVVFDSDGDPTNDWIVVPPFVWDYYQGTDRWYQLIWNHLTRTWSVNVIQVDAAQTQTSVPSAVRVVIIGDSITWFIPRIELPSATPSYRFSAFGHDGRFSRADRGGDVSGSDPSVPPMPPVP